MDIKGIPLDYQQKGQQKGGGGELETLTLTLKDCDCPVTDSGGVIYKL